MYLCWHLCVYMYFYVCTLTFDGFDGDEDITEELLGGVGFACIYIYIFIYMYMHLCVYMYIF